MLTHERDLNASSGSSPPKDSKNSGASGDKGKGSQRRTRQTVIKRSIIKVAITRSHDEVWMTLSSHQQARRTIQVPKFLRREVVGKEKVL
jgi:hypothetical protein